MGFLRKNLFWFFCGLVVLAAVIFSAKWIKDAAAENNKLNARLKKNLERLKGIAKAKDKIRPGSFVRAADQYKKKLQAQAEQLQKKFLSRQLQVEPVSDVPEPPPLDDRTRFREWLTMRYKERCNKDSDLGMICERSDPVKHGDIPEGPIEKDDIPVRLRQYLISREIHRILSSTKVTIPCLKPDPTGREEELEGTQERGVQELKRIEWKTEAEMAAGRTGVAVGGRGVTVEPDKFPKPYNSFLFELEFIAHFSLVPKMIQAFENSDSFFFVVRRVDVSKVPKTGKSAVYGPTFRRGGRGAERRREYKNQRYMEAPLRMIVECEVLEFEFSKDKDPLVPKEGER